MDLLIPIALSRIPYPDPELLIANPESRIPSPESKAGQPVRSQPAMARKIEELAVFTKAMEFWTAVDAILDRPSVRRNRKLWDQISDANDSITANMREGFEQSSDDGFANYLVYAKGSVAEVVTRLHFCQSQNGVKPTTKTERTCRPGRGARQDAWRVHQITCDAAVSKIEGLYKVGDQKGACWSADQGTIISADAESDWLWYSRSGIRDSG